jgi:hypothetical protein
VTYYTIGWYAASLVSAAISLTVMLAALRIAPGDFDWKLLDESSVNPNHPDPS